MADSFMDVRSMLVRYVSDGLPAAEREDFEQRLLTDQEFSDEVAAHEQELIDDYAGHRLSRRDRTDIQPWIEASPRRLQRVAMAAALRGALASPPRRAPGRDSRWFLPLGLAACALVAALLYGTEFWLHRSANGRQAALGGQAGVAGHQANMKLPPPAFNPVKADVILLEAEQVRGQQKMLVYTLHPNAPTDFEVVLPAGTALTGYALRVTRLQAKAPLVSYSGLSARKTGNEIYLEAALPAGSLAPGTYVAEVVTGGDTIKVFFRVAWAHE